MKIRLIAVGTRMPSWVVTAFGEYRKRLPRECALDLVEIAPERRGRNAPVAQIKDTECQKLLAAVPAGCRVVALDENGEGWTTRQLADRLDAWLHDGRDVALLVGGPDGLSSECLHKAEPRWSLSPLTLPHPLVRVVVAEQIYRAWSLLRGHPYHRD